MANAENLIGKGFESRSTEELREIQRRGGVNSGIARREKKILQEAILKRLGAKDLDEMVANLVKRAKDNSRDFETLRDTIGEKPAIENKTDITTDGEPITGIAIEVKSFGKD